MSIDYSKIVPVGPWVLVKKRDDREMTASGIVLPGNAKIPNFQARVIAISEMLPYMMPLLPSEEDPNGWAEPGPTNFQPMPLPFKAGDYVIIHHKSDTSVVDVEALVDDKHAAKNLFFVSADCIMGVMPRPNIAPSISNPA